MKSHAFVVASSLILSGACAAYGADAFVDMPQTPDPAEAAQRNWALQVTPYMWAAGLDGHIAPFRNGPTIGVDKSFSDVLNDLDFGGFVNVWGRYERFIVSGDIMYVSTTDSHASGPLPALPVPGIGVLPPGASVEGAVDSKQFTASLLGGYRVVDTPQFTLDALGGMRFWYVSNDVTVTATHPAIGTRTAVHGESFNWVDPVIGARAFFGLTDKFSIQAQADIGGFGAGSDLSWSALATVNYVVNDHLSLSAGYKALDVDYDRGGHVYDVRLSGPVLGATWRF